MQLVQGTGFEVLDQRFLPLTGHTEAQARKRRLTISVAVVATGSELLTDSTFGRVATVLETLHVGQVLGSPHSSLVGEQSFAPKEVETNAPQVPGLSASPGLLERYAIDFGEHVDSARWQSDLVDSAGSREILRTNLGRRERCTELGQGPPYALGILR